MSAQEKKEGMSLTLVEAVETLSNIADLQFDRNLGIAQKHDLTVQDKPLTYHTVHWLHHQDAAETVGMVKETFKVILNYLKNFYKHDYSYISDSQALEGIKTIMVLVGEAAKKLDKYTTLFYKTRAQSVTELKEYKQLQEFYLSRIARKIDEGTLSKWILALAYRGAGEKKVKLTSPEGIQTKHVFVDLEAVKKDTEYELFFLRKEDGSRFFSPRLIRNIKLVSDFENYLGEEKLEDPLYTIDIWRDRAAFASAKCMIKGASVHIEKFYQSAMDSNDRELVETLNKSLVALMMAANPHNLSHHQPLKNCLDYFHDFQFFLRQCLLSRDYQKMMAYPPEKSNKLETSIIKLLHVLCMTLFTQMACSQEILGMVHAMIQEAEENLAADHKQAFEVSRTIAGRLGGEYAALAKLTKLHQHGPLNKILNALEEGEYSAFDPLLQDDLPALLFSLYVNDKKIHFARWPSPTYQEFIHKSHVNEEFKAFLHTLRSDHQFKKCLLINFQDRVNWKEHARCAAIEELPNHEAFDGQIESVTLPRDTEFYHQLAPYHLDNRADVFINHLKKQLGDPDCGFLIPSALMKQLKQGFIDECINAVHTLYFSGKNVLSRENRMDFIEIFYMFLQLKIIEISKPDIVGLSCKDGLDISCSAMAELFISLKLCNQEQLSENDCEFLDLMLYGPCLLTRERIMMPDRFNRMLSAIKMIESIRKEKSPAGFVKLMQKTFGKFYHTPILKGKTAIQLAKDTIKAN